MKLEMIRKQKGIKQQEIADATGVSISAVSHWESGRYKPSVENLIKIAEVLQCSIDELLADSEMDK